MSFSAQVRACRRRFAGRWVFRLVIALGLAVALGYLPYHAFGPAGFGRASRLEREHHQLIRDNARLLRENRSLQRRIERLKSNTRAIDRVARDELGLVRAGDIVFQFE